MRRSSRGLTPAQTREAAYHEAGHAVASIVLGLRPGRVTIVPDVRRGRAGSAQGQNRSRWLREVVECGDPWEHPSVVLRLMNEIMVNQSGGIAGRRITGRANRSGCAGDHHSAMDLVLRLTPSEDGPEVYALLRWLTLRATWLINRNWSAVEAVAHALLERRKLTGQEVRRIVHDAHLEDIRRSLSPEEQKEFDQRLAEIRAWAEE